MESIWIQKAKRMKKPGNGTRAPFQVLVLPFRVKAQGVPEYCLFRRKDAGYWQGIAGGGEGDETPGQAARREALEESGLDSTAEMFRLESKSNIPVANVSGFLWGEEVLLITEHCFGIRSTQAKLKLSSEHSEYKWVHYAEAMTMLKWDSNRTALWELHHRLTRLPHTLSPE